MQGFDHAYVDIRILMNDRNCPSPNQISCGHCLFAVSYPNFGYRATYLVQLRTTGCITVMFRIIQGEVAIFIS